MEIDSYLAECIVISLITLLTVVGLLVVRRWVGLETLASFHEVAGYLLSVIGTMYAVLLGLVVVDSMGKYETAKQIAQQEANALADVFFLSNQYPAQKSEIQRLCLQYADLVVNREWHDMENNGFCQEARETAIKLVGAVSGIKPQGDQEQSLYQVIVGEVTQIWDNRSARIYTACSGLPTAEWVVLIVGAVATVVFTYFFALEHLKAQVVMTAIVTLLISLNVYLVLLYAYPYSGDVRVSPHGLMANRDIFRQSMLAK